jgi:hypothetical protein
MSSEGAVVGVSDHWGWAVLVTATGDGTLVDRRRVELVEEGLSKYPHHHDGAMLPPDEAVALVERVRASAGRCAKLSLQALAADVRSPIRGIALRECPALPATVLERIQDYRAHNVADSVMYREALAAAAEARGWEVYWYDVKKALAAAREALGVNDLDAYFLKVRRAVGSPWSKDHNVAMAAAIAARTVIERS